MTRIRDLTSTLLSISVYSACSVLVLGAAIGPEAHAAEVRWEKVADETTGPSPRFGHAIAYDAIRGKTVLFGGRTVSSGDQADTWEWDGAVWERMAVEAAPPPRACHALVFDSMRGTVVLFGGVATDGGGVVVLLNDAWQWDGESWREIAGGSPPSPRFGAAMADDPVSGSLLLFGGSDGTTCFADTWELGASGWTRLDVGSGPSARNGHALAADSALRRVVLFGGVSDPTGWSETLGDTWEWNGNSRSWRLVSESGPLVVDRSPAMVLDSRRSVFVLYGFALGDLHRTHSWNGDDDGEWVLTSAGGSSPGGFTGALAFDSARGRVVLVHEVLKFGGQFQTWELAPVILVGVTPADGSDAGGDPVSLDGFRVDGDPEGTRVRFGEREASVVGASEGRLRVRPPLGVGTVDVEIETPDGISRLREAYRYVPAAVAARYGSVNVGSGDRENVLLVNGESGDPETRVVEVGRNERIAVEMLSPSSQGEAPFALYAWEDEPTDATLSDAPFGVGRTVFPFPFLRSSPLPRATWNNAGRRNTLGAPTLPSEPAPSTVLAYPGGSRRAVVLTFQGVIRDAGSASASGWSVTNAVILHVR